MFLKGENISVQVQVVLRQHESFAFLKNRQFMDRTNIESDILNLDQFD